MKQAKSIRWQFLLGLALSLVLLIVAFWRSDPSRIWESISGAHRGLLLVAFFLNFLGLLLRAVRWRVLLGREGGPLPFTAFLDSVNIGYLVNNLFPVRLGDLVRSVLLGRWLRIRTTRALSATVVERILDSGLILLLLFSLLTVIPLPPTVVNIGLGMAAAVVAALGLMLLAVAQQERGERWLSRLFSWVPGLKADRWTERFMGLFVGFEALRRAGILGRFLLWSLAVWAQTLLAFWVTLRAFDPRISISVAGLAMVAAALGLAAPSAPAGIGTFEGAVIGALLIVSVDESSARGMAIALHAISFISLNLAGMWSLARRGLGYRSLMRVASQGEAIEGSGAR